MNKKLLLLSIFAVAIATNASARLAPRKAPPSRKTASSKKIVPLCQRLLLFGAFADHLREQLQQQIQQFQSEFRMGEIVSQQNLNVFLSQARPGENVRVYEEHNHRNAQAQGIRAQWIKAARQLVRRQIRVCRREILSGRFLN